MSLRDIDGDDNGAYEDLSIGVRLEQTRGPSGDWDEGEWEAHDVEIQLEPRD